MLDLRTVWLALPEDRYQAPEARRAAERSVYMLLRVAGMKAPPNGLAPDGEGMPPAFRHRPCPTG